MHLNKNHNLINPCSMLTNCSNGGGSIPLLMALTNWQCKDNMNIIIWDILLWNYTSCLMNCFKFVLVSKIYLQAGYSCVTETRFLYVIIKPVLFHFLQAFIKLFMQNAKCSLIIMQARTSSSGLNRAKNVLIDLKQINQQIFEKSHLKLSARSCSGTLPGGTWWWWGWPAYWLHLWWFGHLKIKSKRHVFYIITKCAVIISVVLWASIFIIH